MEERVLAKKDDLITIANAIRNRTGGIEELSLEEMPALIAGIGDGVSSEYQEIADALVLNRTAITDAHLEKYKDATSLAQYAFSYCTSITAADFPNLTAIPSYAFGYCNKLTTVNFPNVTSVNSQAFFSCYALSNINFPKLETTYTQTFGSCRALTTAVFPSLKNVGGYTFTSCSNLTTIFLNYNGEGVIKDTYAFRDCSSLTTLVLRSEQIWTLKNTNAFTNTPIASGTGYIYVPSALVDTYKAASNWSTYAAQFRALEDYTVDGTITGDLDETKIAATAE